MKKYILIIALIFTYSGCAWTKQQIDYAKLCQADPACLSQAKSDSELAKNLANAAYPLAGAPIGAAILGLSLWYRGRKKSKEQQNG